MSSVLLAEDEFLIRAVLVEALGSAGFSCIEAPTGKEALAVLAGGQPLAAAIVDLGLPDMPGLKVIEAAVKHRPACRSSSARARTRRHRRSRAARSTSSPSRTTPKNCRTSSPS